MIDQSSAYGLLKKIHEVKLGKGPKPFALLCRAVLIRLASNPVADVGVTWRREASPFLFKTSVSLIALGKNKEDRDRRDSNGVMKVEYYGNTSLFCDFHTP